MITEIRMIAFSPDALAEAVRLFGQANQDRFFTQVREVYVRPGAPPVVVAEVCGDDSDATDTLEFTSAETAAFLILLCRRQRIPLPHHAEKSLRLVGGELCLMVARKAYPSDVASDTTTAAADLDPTPDFDTPDGA